MFRYAEGLPEDACCHAMCVALHASGRPGSGCAAASRNRVHRGVPPGQDVACADGRDTTRLGDLLQPIGEVLELAITRPVRAHGGPTQVQMLTSVEHQAVGLDDKARVVPTLDGSTEHHQDGGLAWLLPGPHDADGAARRLQRVLHAILHVLELQGTEGLGHGDIISLISISELR